MPANSIPKQLKQLQRASIIAGQLLQELQDGNLAPKQRPAVGSLPTRSVLLMHGHPGRLLLGMDRGALQAGQGST